METTTKTYTYADYQTLPEGAPYQLMGGYLVKSPSPTYRHQDLLTELVFAFTSFVKEHDLGKVLFAPMDVHLSETDVVQPDLLFISHARSSIITEKEIAGAPDLVIEILSPSTAYYDLRHKKRLYAEHGVLEYWIVDPQDESVEVYLNRDAQFVLNQMARTEGEVRATAVPEFTLNLNLLF